MHFKVGNMSGTCPERFFFAVRTAVFGLFFFVPVYVVTQTMTWNGNFPAVNLGSLTSRSSMPEGSSTATLTMTGDVEITADNSTASRLSEAGGDTLMTEYKLVFDGDGVSNTGGPTVSYASYNSFLSSPVSVTHVDADNEVDVTLYVRAYNDPDNVADAGSYTATQTLTASWVGP